MSETEQITPGERRELRAVVRQQIKVLRAEVEQRKAELLAEAEARLVEKYRTENERSDELMRQVNELQKDVNRQLADLLREYEELLPGSWHRGQGGFSAPMIRRNHEDRKQLHAAMVAGVEAQVKQAKVDLDRQEADLLKDLALDSLQTSAARAFLGRIPQVAELVPSRRLREIEAQFDAAKGGAQ